MEVKAFKQAAMNFVFESVKGDRERLFGNSNMHHEFRSFAIRKVLKILSAGIIVPVGKMIQSNKHSVGRGTRNGPFVRPMVR
jgi:hypothetical protein